MAHERMFDVPGQGAVMKLNAMQVSFMMLESADPQSIKVRLACGGLSDSVQIDFGADHDAAQAFFDLWVERVENAR